MTKPAKPIASLSLDLDNQWSYMKAHGDEGWQSFPSYLDLVVPRILEMLDELDCKITFFIVGQDAALDRNGTALARIAAAGHEVANHSFAHEPWLHRHAREDVEREIVRAEAAIEAATGLRSRGFRGPGFSLSRDILETLKARGYDYDASTLPTFLGPVARAYYFFNAQLSRAERQQRADMFGTFRDGMRPLKPYYWELDQGHLLEIPVTTVPLARSPFHLSYVSFLAQKSRRLAHVYFQSALRACRLAGVAPSVLLHPLDFLGGDDIEALRFFPGMGLRAKDKLVLTRTVLGQLVAGFDVVPMSRHAAISGLQPSGIKCRAPDFGTGSKTVIAARGS